MGLETGNYLTDLVITNPTGGDPKSTADDHLRLLKKVLKECLNGFAGAILLTATETGTASAHVLTPTTALVGYTAGLMLLYRPSNAGTGALTVNVSALGAKNVKTIAGADPTSGDILANQPILLYYDGTNFVILGGSGYLAKTGNQTMTGNLTITGTAAVSSHMTVGGTLGVTGDLTLTDDLIVNDDVTVGGDVAVTGAITGPSMTAKADLASPALTGVPTAPTAAVGTSTTQIATMQAIAQAVFAATIPVAPADADKFVYTADGVVIGWADVKRWGKVLAVASAAGEAAIDFNGHFTTTYDEYELHFQNVMPSATAFAWLRVSKDGGATYLAGTAYDLVGLANQANVILGGSAVNSTSATGISGVVRFFKPAVSTVAAGIQFHTSNMVDAFNSCATVDLADTIDAVRFMFATGNVASGTFQLIGLRKAV